MDQGALRYENNLFPVPAALLTFRSGARRPRFVSVNWLGMADERPAVLSAAFRATPEVLRDLRSDGGFAVNLLPEDLRQQPVFRRALFEAAGDLQATAGFFLCEDRLSPAPMIAECPIRFECRTAVLYSHFDQEFIRGEILAVHLKGIRFGRDEAADFYRLDPLAAWHCRSGGHPFACLPV